MSNPTPPQPEDRLDDYLDGLLDEDEQRVFEQVIKDHPDLQAQIETQRRADAATNRLFASPLQDDISAAVDRILTPGAASNSVQSTDDDKTAVTLSPSKWNARFSSTWRRVVTTPITGGRWASVAAILLLVTSLALVTWRALQPAPPRWPVGYDEVVIHGDLIEVYDQLIASGFSPLWECPPPLFSATIAARFGQGIEMGGFPTDVQALGLSYADSLSPSTLLLLAHVNEDPVVVFIDLAEHEQDALDLLTTREELHTHRKIVGNIILIEVSPLDQPRVLPSLGQFKIN